MSGRNIILPGGGPDCPGCEGPTYQVSDDLERTERPWWCPDCNVRLDEQGEYGGMAHFPAGSKPEGQ